MIVEVTHIRCIGIIDFVIPTNNAAFLVCAKELCPFALFCNRTSARYGQEVCVLKRNLQQKLFLPLRLLPLH